MDKPLLETHPRRLEGLPVVDVRGDIIAYTGPGLKQVLLDTAEGGAQPHVLVNLRDVDTMDSSGLGALLQAMKQAHPSVLHFYGCTSHVRRVLDITGLNRVFDLHATEEEALAHAQAGADASAPARLTPAFL